MFIVTASEIYYTYNVLYSQLQQLCNYKQAHAVHSETNVPSQESV